MSENVLMCKITHFCAVLRDFEHFWRNSYLLTKYKIIDAKIAHFM